MKQTEEKINAMKRAVKSKTPLALAMLEDESVRLAGEKAAHDHLAKLDKLDSGIPYWAWAVLWFAFGILFDITVTNFAMHFWKFTGGCAG